MKDSTYVTLDIAAIGAVDATTIAKAADIPLRVLMSNESPVVIFISKSPGDVAPTPTTSSYRIYPGRDKVFIIAPKQTLYAIGAGTGGLLSVSTSEALPER